MRLLFSKVGEATGQLRDERCILQRVILPLRDLSADERW